VPGSCDCVGTSEAEDTGDADTAAELDESEDAVDPEEVDDAGATEVVVFVRETQSAFLERDETLRIELRTSSRGKRSAMNCLISRVVLRRAAFNQSPTDSSDRCGAIKLAALRWISPRDIASPTSGNFRAARATPMRLYATPSEKHKTLKQ